MAVRFLAVAIMAISPKIAISQTGNDWVGKRVVQKSNTFALRIESRVVERSQNAVHIYRVEQFNNGWLWLKAEGQGLVGWATVNDVVPVDDAITFFTNQIRANPGDASSYRMRALIWLRVKKELDIALGDYNEALRLDPSATSYSNRGTLWDDKKDYDKAIADYNEAIRLDPNHALAYNNRGLAWYDKKEYDKAVADYNEAIRLDPNGAVAFNNRGSLWGDKKEYDKAVADYNEAIRLDPKYAVAYYNRGLAWYGKKEYDKAIADYSEAIRLDPNHALAYNNRGNAWQNKKEYDKAIADYSEAIRLDPKFAFPYYGRGAAWDDKKDYDKAIADYSEAIRIDPNDALAYNGRAWLWATCPDGSIRDGKKAVESAKRACELTENKDFYCLGTLAASYAETGDFDTAVKTQETAIGLLTDAEAKKDFTSRLELYRARKSYRLSP